jgi:thiamine biosynthesis lipoprotein
MRRAFCFLLVLALGSLEGAGCSLPEAPPSSEYVFMEPHMGTKVLVKLWATSPELAERAARAAFGEIAAVDACMSDYKPESELSLLNAAAGRGPRPVSAPLFEVLSASRLLAERSDGAFDVTIAPVVLLWRRARRERKLPDPAELAAARSLIGWRDLVLDPTPRTAELRRAGMRLDLGGIAKGYASDRALAAMAREGVRSAYVDCGGGMSIGDAPPGRDGWRIGIVDDASRALLLRNCGVSTAGDLEQFVVIDGARYSHIVDPRTGLGLTDRAQCTVVAPTGFASDAVDTAICILGPERGFALDWAGGFEARLRRSDGDGRVLRAETPGFAALLVPLD